MYKSVMMWAAMALVGVSLACDRPQPRPEQAAAWPAGLAMAQAPAEARDVAVVRQEAKDGEEVVVRGRVGGRAKPFAEGRAVMLVTDLSLKSCVEEGDACASPWDYCCTTPEEILARSATVQVVGADGKPLQASLEGYNGLKPLSEVIVKGKLQKSPDGKTALITATGLHVKQ